MLDGQTHLVKQGWKGHGHPLKVGGRSRPVVIAQKKTLGGIGKDRDESFAFWDHLYDVAAKTIKLKLPGDDSSADSDQESQNPVNVRPIAPAFPTKPHPNIQQLHRTQTGILSNRRPVTLPTPTSSKSPTPPPCSASIISLAKKEAARRTLYSRFLRGPVITQESLDLNLTTNNTDSGTPPVSTSSSLPVPAIAISTSTTQTPTDDKQLKIAEKAARRLAKEERRKAKVARREAREERRKSKVIRDEAKAAKEKRKIERAAKKAAKLDRKREKEQRKAQAEGKEGTLVPIGNHTNQEEPKRKEKTRKKDGNGA